MTCLNFTEDIPPPPPQAAPPPPPPPPPAPATVYIQEQPPPVTVLQPVDYGGYPMERQRSLSPQRRSRRTILYDDVPRTQLVRLSRKSRKSKKPVNITFVFY